MTAFILMGCQPAVNRTLSLSAEDAALAHAAAQRRTQAARAHERSGALARALVEWRAVAALDPSSTEASDAVARLRSTISSGAESRYRQAQDARARGALDQARLEALRALALEPSHSGAQALLREMEHARVVRRRSGGPTPLSKAELARIAPRPVTEKPSPEPAAAIVSPPAASKPAAASAQASAEPEYPPAPAAGQTSAPPVPAGPSEADRARANEQLAAGRAALSRGQLDEAMEHFQQAVEASNDAQARRAIAETRSALAAQYYEQGERAFRSDIDLAVRAFEQAVRYDPDHPRARLRLEDARKVRAKLAKL